MRKNTAAILPLLIITATATPPSTAETVLVPILASASYTGMERLGEYSHYSYIARFNKIPLDIPTNELNQTCREITSGSVTHTCHFKVWGGANDSSIGNLGYVPPTWSVTGNPTQTLREYLASFTATTVNMVYTHHPNVNLVPTTNLGGKVCGLMTVKTLPTGPINSLASIYAAQPHDTLPILSGYLATCIGLALPQNYCAMETPSVTFDFGTIQKAQYANSRKTESVKVWCSTSSSYSLSLLGSSDGKISLSNGTQATLTTGNGTALGSRLSASGGTNTVSLTATLSGTPTTTGAFTGAGVIIVSMM